MGLGLGRRSCPLLPLSLLQILAFADLMTSAHLGLSLPRSQHYLVQVNIEWGHPRLRFQDLDVSGFVRPRDRVSAFVL